MYIFPCAFKFILAISAPAPHPRLESYLRLINKLSLDRICVLTDYVKPSVCQKKKNKKRRKICLPTINLNAALPRPPPSIFHCSFQYVKSEFPTSCLPQKVTQTQFCKSEICLPFLGRIYNVILKMFSHFAQNIYTIFSSLFFIFWFVILVFPFSTHLKGD